MQLSSSSPQWFCSDMPAVIVFMAALYMYYAPWFVLFEHSVCHEAISVLINVFTLPPLAVRNRHVALKPS